MAIERENLIGPEVEQGSEEVRFERSIRPLALGEYLMGGTVWPSQQGWAVLAYVTVFPSFLAQIFFVKGVTLIGPARAGVFINLVPVFAAILAVSMLGEAFRWYHLGALALVLLGIWLAERRAV